MVIQNSRYAQYMAVYMDLQTQTLLADRLNTSREVT